MTTIYDRVPRGILIYLLKNPNLNMSRIQIETKYNYKEVFDIVKLLENMNLIITNRTKRERICTLTEKGTIIAKKLSELEEVLKT